MEQRERIFQHLIEHSFDAIMLIDRQGIIRYASPAQERILGHPPETLIGHHALEGVHPDDRASTEQALERLMHDDVARIMAVFRCQHASGPWCWIEAVGSNRLNDVELNGVVVNYRDITDRVALDQQQHARLRLDGALLVARTAAHEINNALMPVVGYTDLLAIQAAVRADPVCARLVRQVADAAQHVAELVRQLPRITHLEEIPSVLGPDLPILDLARSTARLPSSPLTGTALAGADATEAGALPALPLPDLPSGEASPDPEP